MDFAFFAIAFNIKKMVAKMTKEGLFSYLSVFFASYNAKYLVSGTLEIEIFKKQKLVVHPYRDAQRVFSLLFSKF